MDLGLYFWIQHAAERSHGLELRNRSRFTLIVPCTGGFAGTVATLNVHQQRAFCDSDSQRNDLATKPIRGTTGFASGDSPVVCAEKTTSVRTFHGFVAGHRAIREALL